MSDHNLLTGNNYGLAGVNHRALRQMLGNASLNFVGLVIGSGTTSAIDYDAFDYTIGGRTYEIVAGADEALTVLDYVGDSAVQAADTTCFYMCTVNAAGVENVIKGKDDETTNLPGIPDTECLMGIVKVVTVAVTFTVGTTDFDASGVTATFYDYIHAPVTAP